MNKVAARAAELRNRPRVRHIAQWAVIAALVIGYLSLNTSLARYRHDSRNDRATVRVVGSMLAEACGAADMKALRREGLVKECQLARQGKITEVVPARALPSLGASPNPDTLPDKPGDTIGPDRTDGRVPASRITAAVDTWFSGHDLSVTPGYRQALRSAVVHALAQNPPQRGKPGRAPRPSEIAAAVTAALLADPPKDGVNGRGVSTAALDGCAVVFTYTDGSKTRVGPVCGPQGPPGVAGEPGPSGGPGPAGPKGDPGYPVSFTTADGQTCTDPDGDHRYECQPGQPPAPGPEVP